MKILIALCFIFSQNLSAKGPLENIEVIQTETEDGATLKGIRLINKDQEKVLLVHGFSENYNVFETLAQKLHSMGYDVYAFNMRGHGNDDQKSKVRGYQSSSETNIGIFGFDHIVARDVPAMIDFVYDGKPILVLGHSLGGSAARAFLNGIRDYGDGIHQTQDSRKLNKYLKKVKTLINVGSPTSFQISDFRFKIWTKLPERLTNFMLTPIMRKYLGEYIFSGLIEKDNIENTEKLFTKGFSVIPPDLIQDVQRWSEEGFESRNGASYEGQKISTELSMLQIVGGKDQLVPLSEVLREHEKNHITESPQIVVMKNFDHIDLVYGKKSSSILEPLISFFLENKSLSGLKKSNELKVVLPKTRSCTQIF